MKKKLFYGVAAVILVALLAAAGCSNPLVGGSSTNDRQATAAAPVSQSVASLAGDPVEIVLLTGQDQVAGIVNVTNDSENLYVEFLPSDEWCIIETHVHAANSLDGFPLVGRWQTPAPGQFAHKTDHNCEPPYEYTIALGDLDVTEEFILAAHAKLSNGSVTETAWAAGIRFADQGNWATYFRYSWKFLLTLEVDPAGTGSVAYQGRYPADAEVELSAEPIEHWQFVSWTDEDSEPISDEWEFYYTMPAQDQTLTANFEQILYELTLVVEPADGGEVSGAGSYPFEEVIELTATANEGYVFVKWRNEDGDTVSEYQNTTYTMPGGAQELTAVFEPLLYELTLLVVPPDGGSVTGGGLYPKEQEIQLTATANEGFVFVKWTNEAGDLLSSERDFLFTMPGTLTILTAEFETAVPQDLESFNIGTLRYVPGGTFQRDWGSTNITTVSPFYMSVYEITQAQYMAVTGKPNPSHFAYGTDAANRPVEMVSWYDALVFCNLLSMAENRTPVYTIADSTDPAHWIEGGVPATGHLTWEFVTMDMAANGYRLPTEAEWMWAAMGATSGHGYPGNGVYTTGYLKAFAGSTGSNRIDKYAWHWDNSGTGAGLSTHPVGTKLPNELGLYDMSGNVWEWTWDWWASSYPSGSLTDPTGPLLSTARVLKGGSFTSDPYSVGVFGRSNSWPYYRGSSIGFRVVSR